MYKSNPVSVPLYLKNKQVTITRICDKSKYGGSIDPPGAVGLQSQ